MAYDIATRHYQFCFDDIVSFRDYLTPEPECEIAFDSKEFIAYAKTEHARITKKLVKHHAAHYDGANQSDSIKNDTQYLKCIEICLSSFHGPSMRKEALKLCNGVLLWIAKLKAANDKNRINCDKALCHIEILMHTLKNYIYYAMVEKAIALLQYKHYGSMKGSKLIICVALLMKAYAEVPIKRQHDVDEKLVESIKIIQYGIDKDVMHVHNLAQSVYDALLDSDYIEALRHEDEAFSYALVIQREENDQRSLYEITQEAMSNDFTSLPKL